MVDGGGAHHGAELHVREAVDSRRLKTMRTVAGVAILAVTGLVLAPAQALDGAAEISRVDAAVQARYINVLGFTDIEHYAVFRGDDETHPVAEMTVKDTYKKDVGKTYTVLSESGSGIVLRFGLKPLLENEEAINEPGNVENSWFTSANYAMKLKPGGVQKKNGRDCFVFDITPNQEAPNLIKGTMWVDARDGTLVEIDGVGSKSPSAFSGAAHMMRQYSNIDGFSMATHARAESDSFLFGRSVVVIDYSNYHLQIRGNK